MLFLVFMKSLLLKSAVGFLFLVLCVSAFGQTNQSAVVPKEATKDLGGKYVRTVMDHLQLADTNQETAVRTILVGYFLQLKSWHAQNDGQIKALWTQFNKARSAQNNANADAALAKLAEAYKSFQPVHAQFTNDLAKFLSPEQIELVKDTLTVNKVKVTYGVYLQIFPKLTDEQKAVVLADLKAAREEAIDAESMTEKSAFFKKFKIIIESDYLTKQGYDPAQARKDFANRQKTKPATQSQEDESAPAKNKN
jgi:hypothetical protein